MRLRIAMSMGIVTTLLVIAAGFAFRAYVGTATKATLERTLHSRMQRLQAALRQGLVPLAPPSAPARPALDQSIIQVISRSGQLLYTTGTAGTSPLLSTQYLAKVESAGYRQIQAGHARNPILLLAEPSSSKTGEIVVVGASTDQIHDSLAFVDQLLWGGGLLAILLATLGAGLAAGVVLRPVERMRRQAAMLSLGDSRAQLADPGTGDELAKLAATLNDFLARLHETTGRQRRFISAASHELRTPLAGMRAELETRSPAASDKDEALLQRLDRRVAHLVSLAEGLLRIAEGQGDELALDISPTDLEAVISAALVALTPLAGAKEVALVLDATIVPTLWLDRVRITEVVENLVVNAIRHAPVASTVEVGLRAERETAVISVRDHGQGVPESMLPRIFEPFARGPQEHGRGPRGSGLGLSLVQLLVLAHRGSVSLVNHPEGGALAEVRLPLAEGPQEGGRTDDRHDDPTGGKPGAGAPRGNQSGGTGAHSLPAGRAHSDGPRNPGDLITQTQE